MSKEIRLREMLETARAQSRELMKEKHAVGAVVFGSAASGGIHEESDVDLAVVYNTVAAGIRVGKEERKTDGVRVEVWRYPITPFVQTFEDEKLRGKPDTWMWTSLWIEIMQTGLMLTDPTGRLGKWQTKAKAWKWRENEINPVANQAEDNLKAAQKHSAQPNPFHSLICLREALTCLTAAYVMKHGLIPSFRPKELSLKLRLIKDKEQNLASVFDTVNDTANLDYNLVESLQLKLKEWVDSEWGEKRLGPRTELENAKSCLRRRDLTGALLSLRYSAYWLGFHILNKRGIKTTAEICNGENHIDMITRLAANAQSFHEFYKQLNFAEKWNNQQVEATIGQTQAVLDEAQ